MKKILFLINPISGTRGKGSLTALVERKTKEAGFPFEIIPTVASGDYRFLEEKIREEQIETIAICGGDGSVNQVVRSLAHLQVKFGIIPMGSGNGLALTAGIPRNSEKALDILYKGKAQRTDAFQLNDKFACMLAGLGFDAAVAHEFAGQKKRGLAKYTTLTLKHFFGAKPFPFSIEANGFRFDTEAFFISIANSNQFGNNFTIAPRASLSDGMLDIVIVKKMIKPRLFWNVMRQVIMGKVKKPENSLRAPIIYFQCEKLHINNPGKALLHIDGDPAAMMESLHIKVLPNYFDLIGA